jgi:very-short-patch-repair endonuclease
VYFRSSGNIAVFVDGPVHEHAYVAERDHAAQERLFDVGWEVVRFPHDADWSAIAAQLERYFGSIAGR